MGQQQRSTCRLHALALQRLQPTHVCITEHLPANVLHATQLRCYAAIPTSALVCVSSGCSSSAISSSVSAHSWSFSLNCWSFSQLFLASCRAWGRRNALVGC